MIKQIYEKVNMYHPDKIADRIAGAVVDLAYKQNDFPKVAVEVMIGHGECVVMVETTEDIKISDIGKAIERISPEKTINYINIYQQDKHLTKNQDGVVRCGDNGIFKGLPITETEKRLSHFAKEITKLYPSDGKYILDNEIDKGRLVISQSYLKDEEVLSTLSDLIWEVDAKYVDINKLGYWTGGTNVDVGITNRKLGSDMAQAVTGGGLHGKDLSKADVSLNIYAHLLAQEQQEEVFISCAIGDEHINGKPYEEIVETAREYINQIGGFEKFAEWGLI